MKKKMFKVRICSRHPSHKAIVLPRFNERVRVRFGSQNIHRKCLLDFNSIEAISNTANKMKMKQLFDIHGIKSPKYFFNDEAGKTAIIDGALGEECWFKTPFHSRGRGMIVYDSKEESITNTTRGYFEESQVADREFRVHVMDGVAFYVDEKRPREIGVESKIKNMANGYKFRRPLRDYPDEVVSESIKAVEALGLDFGAADVGVNSDGVWIYEVNSAPSLRTKTRKLYQKAIVKAIYTRLATDGSYNGKTVDELSDEYNEWLNSQPLTD